MKKSGAEAYALFDQAMSKYDEALKIKPDNHIVLDACGVTLLQQAKRKSGDENERALGEHAESLLG